MNGLPPGAFNMPPGVRLDEIPGNGPAEPEPCEQCGGQGWYMDGPPEDPNQRQCEACKGTGVIISE